MIAVHNISASAEIIVMSVWSQHIVNIIVNSLETKTRAHLVAFCSVIKYNIKNDLDSIFLQLPDQVFEFISLVIVFLAYHRIKPHAPPLVRAPVNSFEFHSCERTPQAEYLMCLLQH